MTNQEANKELERAFDVLDHTCHMDNRRKEAFNMARLALFAEPCEDCISRADAIANIRILYPDMPVVDIMGARHKWSEKYQQYRDCEKILADLPSIQPKTKMGHWITQWNVVHQKEYYYCSECREEFSYDGETGIKMNDYNFCPACGAKMESEDKE